MVLNFLERSAKMTMGNSRPLDLWMLIKRTPPPEPWVTVSGSRPASSSRRSWVTKANTPR